MNSSIYHNVPVMIQPQSWACWYTSFQMTVAYYRRSGTRGGLIDPSENATTQAIYQANQGIGAADAEERERVARSLGFDVLYASLAPEGMWSLLHDGPVIYAGAWPGQTYGHWVVITGISEDTLSINNPASGEQIFNYDSFMGQFLLQTKERPLIY
jgi:ABC-type bacteriocin/lantibiotic exporter with double-glycine peptidase domain